MMRRALVIVLALALVSACGWRLRGTVAMPAGLETLYVNEGGDSQRLASSLRDLLTANNVTVAEQESAAQLVINLLAYDEERRVVAVGDNTLVTEYELIAETEFSIEDGQGNTLLPADRISLIRSYEYDQDNVLGKEEEERLIQEEMRRETAQQIIRRLRFLNVGDPSAKAPAPATEAP